MIVYASANSDDWSKVIGDYRNTNLRPLIEHLIVDEFTSQEVISEKVKPSCISLNKGLVTITSHGIFNKIDDHFSSSLFQTSQNDLKMVFKGKVVHFLACDTGQALGPKLVNNGCFAFFGYDEDFLFPAPNGNFGHLLKYFMEPDNTIVEMLANGATTGDAAKAALAAYDNSILEVTKACQDAGSSYINFITKNKERFCYPNDNNSAFGATNVTINGFV